jgi:FAD/FMN-containing dehydrogenase/Fe-S oxidoreductase
METTPIDQQPIRLQRSPDHRLEGLVHHTGTDYDEHHPLVRALVQRLNREVEGEVRFDAGSRALYATDGSNYRQVPIGLVIPKSVEDVEATIAACRQFDVPVLSRGGGTSLAGQCCNVAVVMDFSKYLCRLIEFDPEQRKARVQPGLVLDDLRHVAWKHGLTFGPDPSTHTHCTLGGMIGNNACGTHAQAYGRTSENIHELEVLTYDGLRMKVGPTTETELAQIIAAGGRRGEIYAGLKRIRDLYGKEVRQRFPRIPRRVSGYALEELLGENHFNVARALCGTEGTCVTFLEATVQLKPWPRERVLVVLGFTNIFEAADRVPEVLEHEPIALEGIDDVLVEDMKKKQLHPSDLHLLPEGRGWLAVEFGANDRARAEEKANRLVARMKSLHAITGSKLYDKPHEEKLVWEIRESGLGATARVPGEPDTWEGWEDSAVAPQRLGAYLRELKHLYDRFGYKGALYGHFGQGCVHTRIDFGLTSAQGVHTFHDFLDKASSLVVRHGGSLSGEHGDGQSKAEFLPKMYGDDLVRAFAQFKAVWDPRGRMNPGKIVDPYLPTENLRLGADFESAHPSTHFSFSEDDGDFTRATLRCVGVGKCRRESSGIMCPSYQVTREERHSTRGRAHLLFEMLEGQVIHDGWRSDAVREALDLCLACKGCKSECPVNVDMATYKAEFLSHHYAGRLRPRAAYAMGLIRYWARLASLAPRLVNWAGSAPGLSAIAKWAAGIAPERSLPKFAERTFRDLYRERRSRREQPSEDRPRVILWPDTFTEHFHPEVGLAALDVLEAAGFQVEVSQRSFCCGRPLYDFGMLDLAKSTLRQLLDGLKEEIHEGTAVVVLEPSCLAVFRDELKGLLPRDEDAQRLARQSFTLGEFLDHFAPQLKFPSLGIDAIVQPHCHQKSLIGMQGDERMLERAGVHGEMLDAGCCGMAGSFGFEKDKYEISTRCSEQKLLPRVRQSPDSLVIADGFSCRTQIEQATARHPLHLAEVLHLALRKEGRLSAIQVSSHSRSRRRPRASWALAAIAATAGVATLVSLKRARSV